MGQTVTLISQDFEGSNPSLPTLILDLKILGLRMKVCKPKTNNRKLISGSSSVGRAIAFQAIGREFEPRLPLFGSLGSLFSGSFVT